MLSVITDAADAINVCVSSRGAHHAATYRARRDAGEACFRVPLNTDRISMVLESLRLLDPRDRDKRDKIVEAIRLHFDRLYQHVGTE